ncbi:MAG TPA: MBOAT family protein, partial [Stellaceae bacterium]|nr:MBOAT family protein [Stellaceae bacterium]
GLFFLVVFTVAWALAKRPTLRIAFLTAASYVFYAFWDWRFCGLLFGSSAVNFLFGQLVHRARDPGRRKFLTGVAVAINLAVLGYFKYCNFFISTANGLLEAAGSRRELDYLGIILPVGISFFTFHGISYVVDLYRGKLERPASFLNMLLYISFFPQLVAGPIVRAAHFLPQLATRPDPDDIRATRAWLLILGGLFKKVVIANYLATDLVDDVFFDPTRYGALDLLLATYGYAAQIYCDFSAYTDIAIGVAALLGYRFPENFDQPYRALGLRDFWTRWHISLSSWLRDYLYIPLGGNEGGRRYLNLMITMLLGGLWHGAAWNFVIWGGLHGALLVGEHLLWPDRKTLPSWPWWKRALGIVVTFHLVCLTWIFFRSPDLDHALSYLAGFSALSQAPAAASPFVLTLLALGMLLHFLPRDRIARLEVLAARIPMPLQGALVGAGIVAIDALGPSGVAPFIYFQF